MEKKVEGPITTAPNGQIGGLDEPPKRKMTIVEQVDEILQDLLKDSPLKAQNIRLTEIYNKGVVVWVGMQYFEGIDAVPNEDVKQLIKTAVKKWEVKNSSR
jgi:2,3-bisphosphoglycerate-independent phosphoglycerate mutase